MLKRDVIIAGRIFIGVFVLLFLVGAGTADTKAAKSVNDRSMEMIHQKARSFLDQGNKKLLTKDI